MGWGFGVNAEGREVGYSVVASCDLDGCGEQIDRGLYFVCGGMHDGGDHGCGRYFCEKHLVYTGCESVLDHSPGAALCDACAGRWERSHRCENGLAADDV